MAKLANVNKAYLKQTSTYTWLKGEQNNSFNRTAESLEVSDKDSEWAQFISGKKGATIDITVYADNTDAGQKAALAAFEGGSAVDAFIGVLGGEPTTPSDGDACSAIITAIGDTNDYGAVATRSISLTATGAVTHYPAA